MNTQQTNESSKQLSAIERALAAAKARKAAKESSGDNEAPPTIAAAPRARGIEVKTAVLKSDRSEQKAARAAELERLKTERAAAREVRAAERAKRKEAREADRSTKHGSAHMKKVETARSKLPKLAEDASSRLVDITNNLSTDQIEALAFHLQFHVRLAATKAAPAQPFKVGTQVRITGGEPRFVGMVGTVTKSQKLRSFVSVPGRRGDVYTFTAHLSPVES